MPHQLPNPRITLEQWRCFVAVVEAGGFAQAAEVLSKSQSTVSYAVNKMQSILDIELLEIQGRKAELTEAGKLMYKRAKELISEAASVEALVTTMKSCWEPELRIVVDAIFPMPALIDALKAFEPESQGTAVRLEEVILSGADEAIEEGRAELVIGHKVPEGFLGDVVIELEFAAVAHPSHPLFQLGREINSEDLMKHLHVVVRDSGQYKNVNSGWVKSKKRWTVSTVQASIQAISNGLGFAWLPVHTIQAQLDSGSLAVLPIIQGRTRKVPLYLVYGHPTHVGPATKLLAEKLNAAVTAYESSCHLRAGF